MKIAYKKIRGISAGFAIAMLAAGPAFADDTELLLINPDPSLNPKPNVLFILDSSGSMGDDVSTTNPYDPDEVYTGDCNTDHIYWTDVDVIPDCSVTTNFVHDDDFVCEYASRQIAGIGSFTNTMVQYRDGGPDGTTSGEPERWQYLAPGYNDHKIECQADSGVHGDGDSSRLWASNGTNLSEPFANDASMEVSWGSAPRNLSYTVYDGNYINWKNNPETVDLSKSFIMKTVAKKVLSSVDNLNVGLMRFDGNDGGAVILDITDLDSNRQSVLDAVDAIPAGGNTPLSETMYEAALFWRGLPAKYGSSTYTNLTDANALAVATAGAEVYEQPEWDVCAKNYNVLLSDGRPVEDFDPPTEITNLPGIGGVLGYAGCDGDILPDGGQCLDDIAEYLSKNDVDPNEDEDQLVVTHTIGFDIDLPILEETALNSGGEYFLANDVESLTKTLLSIIANINDRSLSFTAPAVSVNTFNRTRNFNDLYITAFGARSRAHWPGNLKKYRILDGVIVDDNDDPAVDPGTGFFYGTAQSIWTPEGTQDGNNVRAGGAASQLPDPANRNLYTDISGTTLHSSTNHVSSANISTFTLADFGLTGADGEPSMDELIRWARGEDLRNEDNNTETDVRKAMGDPLHSQPAAVVYGGTEADPEVVIFTATNDGYLHAVDGETGEELWAYIPEALLGNLTRLYFDPAARYKQYGLDGNVVPIIRDVDGNGVIESSEGDFVIVIFGMRRGGNDYFALNVTDKTKPELLWKTSLPQGGESWSTPVIARVDIDGVTQNGLNAVAIMGGGYDVIHDTNAHPVTVDSVGAGVHMLDLISGAPLWRAGPDAGANLTLDTTDREMTRAIPNEVRVIDLNGDQLADRMYATDLGGQIWRFDITNGNPANTLVTGGVIAQLGAEGPAAPSAANTRRFYNAPDVSLVTDAEQQRRYISVSVGSGYRAHPFDLSAADRFYSVRDADVFNQLPQDEYNTYDIVEDADLVEVSGQVNTVITSSDRGWKFTLPPDQKVLSDSITFNDEIFFVAFSPQTNENATCAAGRGTNYLYRMSAVNGDPVVPNLETLDPDDSDDERVKILKQGGIAPSPAILFPTPEEDCTGDACDPEPIYCVGVECDGTGFDNNPVRTLWTQDGIE